MSDQFPISVEQDSYVARREFTKFLGLASIAFVLGTFLAAGRKLWKELAARHAPAVRICAAVDVPATGYKLFRYPTENDPCILLRIAPDRFTAFNQNCTHLMCPVYFDTAAKQLACPCHKAFFSCEDGQVLAGPPKRPLERLAVTIRGSDIWVGPS